MNGVFSIFLIFENRGKRKFKDIFETIYLNAVNNNNNNNDNNNKIIIIIIIIITIIISVIIIVYLYSAYPVLF